MPTTGGTSNIRRPLCGRKNWVTHPQIQGIKNDAINGSKYNKPDLDPWSQGKPIYSAFLLRLCGRKNWVTHPQIQGIKK